MLKNEHQKDAQGPPDMSKKEKYGDEVAKSTVLQDSEIVVEAESAPEIAPEMAKDLGEFIRLVRMQRGISIHTASEALNIRRDYLTAIEENRWSHLPGSVYTIGFLKAYAAYLNINPMGAVEAYKTQSEQQHAAPETLILPSPIPPHGIPTRFIFGGTFLILILIVIGWFWLSENKDFEEATLIDEARDINAIPLAYPMEDPILPEMPAQNIES